MLANWRARVATTILGIVVCVVVALVYPPILAAHPGDIDVGMNYFADTLFFGGPAGSGRLHPARVSGAIRRRRTDRGEIPVRLMNPQINSSRHCQRHRTREVSFGNFGTEPL
jgi:hypothetical protein